MKRAACRAIKKRGCGPAQFLWGGRFYGVIVPNDIRETLVDLSFWCEEFAGQYPWCEKFVEAVDICIDIFQPYKVISGSSDAYYCERCLNPVRIGETFCPCCKAELVWEESE